MAYAKRRHICGNFIEEERFYLDNNLIASKNRPRVPRDKTKLSSKEQEEKNHRQAEKKARRLGNTNFVHGKDLFVTLTAKRYKNLDEFTNMMKKFVERLRYYFKQIKVDLKYIYCYGEHKEKSKAECDKVGVHAHIVLSGMSTDKLVEIWQKDREAGRITFSTLRFDNSGGIGRLMAYFIKNVKELKQLHKERGEYQKVKNMRAYNPSLNLKQPKVTELEYITRKQFKEYPQARKGFKVMEVENIPTSYGVHQTIHIIRIANMRF